MIDEITLGRAQEMAKAKAKARAEVVRAKADEMAFEQNAKALACQLLIMVTPDTLRIIADRMERTGERQSEAVRALVEIGLAAQKGTG